MNALDRYKAFLTKHQAGVQAAEGLLSNVTWLLPERFTTSEIPAELINSLSGLWSIINEHLLLRGARPSPAQLLLQCIHQVGPSAGFCITAPSN